MVNAGPIDTNDWVPATQGGVVLQMSVLEICLVRGVSIGIPVAGRTQSTDHLYVIWNSFSLLHYSKIWFENS